MASFDLADLDVDEQGRGVLGNVLIERTWPISPAIGEMVDQMGGDG